MQLRLTSWLLCLCPLLFGTKALVNNAQLVQFLGGGAIKGQTLTTPAYMITMIVSELMVFELKMPLNSI